MNSPNAFEVRSMNLHYGSFHALKNINLDIPKNQITALIGPSGCGKSTFLRSLNRMNDLVEGCRITGDIRMDGEDIYGKVDVNHLRKRVGMVFQKPNPFPMSIYDNVAYGPRTHGIKNKAQLDALNDAKLTETERLQKQLDALTADYQAAQIDAARNRVAAEEQIPAGLVGYLTGSDEAAIRDSAKVLKSAIAEAAKPGTPAPDPSQGASGAGAGGSTTSQFEQFFNSKLG